MKKSIFLEIEKNIHIIILVSLAISLLFLYNNSIIRDTQEEFFIPDRPSMNEYYLHKKDI